MACNGRPQGQEVKGQGHKRPKLDFESSRSRHTVSDENLVPENGEEVLCCTPLKLPPGMAVCILLTYLLVLVIITRGQSNLTKSASRGAHSPVRGHPRGSKVVPLNSWGKVSY